MLITPVSDCLLARCRQVCWPLQPRSPFAQLGVAPSAHSAMLVPATCFRTSSKRLWRQHLVADRSVYTSEQLIPLRGLSTQQTHALRRAQPLPWQQLAVPFMHSQTAKAKKACTTVHLSPAMALGSLLRHVRAVFHHVLISAAIKRSQYIFTCTCYLHDVPIASGIAVAYSFVYCTVDAAAATPQQEITAVLDESKLRRESHSLQQVSNM